MKTIWVIPEISGQTADISQLSLGLLSEAARIAETTGAATCALVLGASGNNYCDVIAAYGISQIYVVKHPLLEPYSGEAWLAALTPLAKAEKPWLVVMGDTLAGREMAPQLAIALDSAVVPGCVKIDWTNPDSPVFYRPVYGGQAYQESTYGRGKSMVVTFAPQVLAPCSRGGTRTATVRVGEPQLTTDQLRTWHVEFSPADYRTADISEAETVVGAGAGASGERLLPLVQELAELIEGSVGGTRPVIDEGKLPRERLIGQTGKVVSPNLYLALGVSGASHHVGGIQDSRTILAVNRDRSAPIFQSADGGAIADLNEILPALIARIKKAKQDGEIL